MEVAKEEWLFVAMEMVDGEWLFAVPCNERTVLDR